VAAAERYFGVVAQRGETSPPPKPSPPPPLGKVIRETMTDQVEMTKIVMAFPSPAHFAPGDAELDVLGSLLATGKVSRLYRSLVYEKALAQSVSAAQQSSVLASVFTVEIMVRPGSDPDVVEKETDAILADLDAHPPTEEEIRRAKNQILFDFTDHLQSLPARATALNNYWAETGNPGYVNLDLARYDAATTKSVAAQAKKTINLNERVILRITPANGAAAAPKAKKGGRP
jgi:zinc protease